MVDALSDQRDYELAGLRRLGQQAQITTGRVTMIGRGKWNTAGEPYRTTQLAYDPWGNQTVITDTRGHRTQAAYDSQYHLYATAITNALTQTTRYAYDPVLGVITSITDPNNAITHYSYDAFGRLRKVAQPLDTLTLPTLEYVYSDGYSANGLTGLRVQEIAREVSGDSSAVRPIFTFYDGLGRLVQERAETLDNSQQRVTNVTYDARGLTRWTYVPEFETYSDAFTRPDGWDTRAKTSHAYDVLGRLNVVTAPDGTTTTHTYLLDAPDARYSATGLYLEAVVDAANHGKYYVTDAYGRLVVMRELTGTVAPRPLYAETKYAYDVLGQLRVVTDALQNTTVITYNALSQKTEMIDPDMGQWKYEYDPAGNLITQTDALNNKLWFKYDPLNRLVEKRQANSSGPLLASYGYGAVAPNIGYRLRLDDPSGSTTWAYDVRGRMTQETKVISGTGGGTFVTQWNYDTLDRPTWMKYPGGNAGQVGEQVNFTYNAANLLNTVSGANSYVQSTTYDAAGRIDARVLGSNVVQQDYVYFPWTTANGQGRLQQIKAGTPISLTALQDLRYSYDAVGNVLTIQDWKAGSPQTQTFHYDSLDRLTDATASGGTSGTYSTEYYAYNPIGNLTGKAGVTQGYSDPLHKHAVTHLNGVQKFWYDANGNMTTRNDSTGNFTQQWDKENRLITVTGSATGYFVYDGDGNRVKATLNGVTMAYVGNYYEQSGSVTTTYYYAGGTRVAMRQGTTVTYLLGDHLGSTSLAANGTTGALVSEQRYKPWGEKRYPSGASTLPTRRQFTGQINDNEIGLYFYNARSYSSVLGRFLSADTIVPYAKDPQSWNRYSYTRNNLINRIDPSGHTDTLPDDGGIGDLLGALTDLYKDTPMECVLGEAYEYQSALRELRLAEAHFAYIMKFHVGNSGTAYNALDQIEVASEATAGFHLRLMNALPQSEFDPIMLADPGLIAGLAVGLTKGAKEGLAITKEQLQRAVGQRMRHYTSISNAAAIQEQGVIRASTRQWKSGCVFCESADQSALSPRDAESVYGLKRGRGNAYIEFDVAPGQATKVTNPRTGVTEWVILGDVTLAGRSPTFYYRH